jgi:N,N'-diacetyllegionaminate synthase
MTTPNFLIDKFSTLPPKNSNVFVIAEAGVNHNGDVELAKKLIDIAQDAGADAVKFQTWKPGEISGSFSFKVDYQKQSSLPTESCNELLDRLCLPYSAFKELQAYSHSRGILFLSTPDGFESLDFLVDELNLPLIKVGSTEVTHVQFLEAVGSKNLPVILSTGLSTLAEIERAVHFIRRGGDASLSLLHCTSEYPAPIEQVNLRAMVTLAETLEVPVGYSDHTVGNQAAIAAVALGARIIEKHFTLSRTLEGPDHAASMEPQELKDYVASIRITETLLGDKIKAPTLSERKNIQGIRRSVVATRMLLAGTLLTQDMLTCKRPGTGIPPYELEKMIGKRLNIDIQKDEPLQWEHLQEIS